MSILLYFLSFSACDDTIFGVGAGGGDESPPDDTEPGGAPDSAPADAPTWYQDVRPIFAQRCWQCHNDETENSAEGVFSWEDYELVSASSAWIGLKLEGDDAQPRYMPPFGARDTPECDPVGEWLDDWRLTDAEMDTFWRWVDAGTPEGDEATAAPAEIPAIPALDGEGIDAYTLQGTQVDPGEDLYLCFSLDPELSETRWIDGVEIRPDNRDVVHHVVLFTDPLGESAGSEPYPCYGGPLVSETQVIFAWAPGGQPMELPAESGVEMQPGSRIIAQVHYHPAADPQSDQSAVAVRWVDEKPAYLAQMWVYGARAEQNSTSSYLEDGEFRIPAHTEGHVETWRQPLQAAGEVKLWAMFPHMHGLGQDILITVEGEDGSRCLSHNDRWDFNWQLIYRYAGDYEALPSVNPGDEVVIRCTYNNTTSADVFVGEDTDTEMCLAIIGVLEPSAGESKAHVRAAHLVPDGPEVDVWLNGSRVLSGLSFGDGTAYAELSPGSYALVITAAGGSLSDPGTISLGEFTASSGVSTTLVAFNELASVQGRALADDETGLAPGDVRVQLFHAAPSWPSLDVLSGDGAPLLEGFALGESYTAPDLPAGAYSFGVDINGDSASDARFTLPDLAGGALVNLYLSEDADGAPLAILHSPDGSTQAVSAD